MAGSNQLNLGGRPIGQHCWQVRKPVPAMTSLQLSCGTKSQTPEPPEALASRACVVAAVEGGRGVLAKLPHGHYTSGAVPLHACPGVTPSSIGGIAPLVSPRLERGAGRVWVTLLHGAAWLPAPRPPPPLSRGRMSVCHSRPVQPSLHLDKTLQVNLEL